MDRFGHEFAHLKRTLPVYFKQHVPARIDLGLEPVRAGRVPVPVDASALEKFTGGFERREAIRGDEMVIDAVDLTGPRRTRGVGPSGRLRLNEASS